MKKSFFKKLSFVLALAMIMSVIAPAAGAFAADKAPSLNSTKKYLHLSGIEGSNEYNFNVNNKKSGWKYYWESSDEDVAVVNEKNGVTTATGVGTAKITVDITDKAGDPVKTLKATVIVRDNIKELEIVLAAKDKDADLQKLAVGKEYDFNRNFKTSSGSTKKTSGITRWDLGDVKAEDATIDDSGIFVAKKAGEYKITANAFQSKDKYNQWLADKTLDFVTATTNITVKVIPSIVETKQVDDTKFTVEFDSDMSGTDVKTASALYRIVNGKRVVTGLEKIKEIKLNDTGKLATVEMYTALLPGELYNFVYGDLVDDFKAATKTVADIAGIILEDFTVNITGTEDMYNHVKAINKDGVIILTGTNIPNLTFSYEGDPTKGYVAGSIAYIYINGYSAPVRVKYSNYIFDDATKTYLPVNLEDTAVMTGVATDSSLNTATMQYQVADNNTVANNDTWKGTLVLAAGDVGFIHTRYKTVSASGANDPYLYTADNSVFNYKEADTSKVVINGTSIYAIAPGTVTVIVTKLDGTPVGTFDVTVHPARSFGEFTQSDNVVTVGNNGTYGETKNVTMTAKDTMGKAFAPSVNYEIKNAPTGANTSLVVITPTVNTTPGDDYGKVTISVTAKGAMAGYYNVKVTLGGFGTSREVPFAVNVVEANTDATKTPVSWRVELSDETVDLNANYGKDVTINVYGYNGSNVRVDWLDPATDYTVEVKKGSTVVSTGPALIPVVTATTGQAVVAYEKTTYQVVASVTAAGLAHFTNRPSMVAGSFINAATFSVVDNTKLDKTYVTAVVSPGTILKAVQDAYDFKLNDNAIDENNIINVKYSVGGAVKDSSTNPITLAAGQNVFVESITYRVTDATTGAHIDYVYALGITLAVK